MHAVVDVRGVQYRVTPGEQVRVPSMPEEPGSKIKLDKVLLLDEGANITIGKPLIEGAVVESTVVEHGREKKILIYKYKRRKDYRMKRGHRQKFTLLRIDNIVYGGHEKQMMAAGEEEIIPSEQPATGMGESAYMMEQEEPVTQEKDA